MQADDSDDPDAVEDARATFKLVKAQRIGLDNPELYLAWAGVEERAVNFSKAARLRADAAACRPLLPTGESDRTDPAAAAYATSAASAGTPSTAGLSKAPPASYPADTGPAVASSAGTSAETRSVPGTPKVSLPPLPPPSSASSAKIPGTPFDPRPARRVLEPLEANAPSSVAGVASATAPLVAPAPAPASAPAPAPVVPNENMAPDIEPERKMRAARPAPFVPAVDSFRSENSFIHRSDGKKAADDIGAHSSENHRSIEPTPRAPVSVDGPSATPVSLSRPAGRPATPPALPRLSPANTARIISPSPLEPQSSSRAPHPSPHTSLGQSEYSRSDVASGRSRLHNGHAMKGNLPMLYGGEQAHHHPNDHQIQEDRRNLEEDRAHEDHRNHEDHAKRHGEAKHLQYGSRFVASSASHLPSSPRERDDPYGLPVGQYSRRNHHLEQQGREMERGRNAYHLGGEKSHVSQSYGSSSSRPQHDSRPHSMQSPSSQSRDHLPPEPFPVPPPENTVYVNRRPYLKLGMIGKGGSSKVFKVLSSDMKIYALKFVKVPPTARAALASYANEIALLHKLKGQTSIVQLHDAEVHKSAGTIQLVMELGEMDLATLLVRRSKAKSIPDQLRRTLWQQMLEAVKTIHEAKIVHGDLKPANFVNVAGMLKLIDFGIAKAIVTDDTTKIVRDGQIGTPNYMAPEALVEETADDDDDGDEGEHGADDNYESGRNSDGDRVAQRPQHKHRYRVGRASDIWSLGCILYQMVYGRTPFAHIKNFMHKINCINDETYEISYPSSVPVHPNLLDVLRGCLQRNPDKRMSMAALVSHPYNSPDEMPSGSAPNRRLTGVSVRETAEIVVYLLRDHGIEVLEGEIMEQVARRVALRCGDGRLSNRSSGPEDKDGGRTSGERVGGGGHSLSRMTPTTSAITRQGVQNGQSSTRSLRSRW